MKKNLLIIAAVLSLITASAIAEVEFTKIDGNTVVGEFSGVKGGKFIVTGGKNPVIPAEEMVRVSLTQGEMLFPNKGIILHLPGGDVICGSIVSSNQTEIEIDSSAVGRIKMPVESLLAIEFVSQAKTDEAFKTELTNNKAASDLVFLANGDRLPGIVVKMDAENITLKTDSGEMALKADRVQGISFAMKNRPALPQEFVTIVRCTDGSLLTGTLQDSAAGTIKIKTFSGTGLDIATQNIIDLTFRNGRLVYLSDLTPASTEYKPFFGGDRTWPFQKDKNYDRNSIRVGGRNYQKGVGTFSGMKLVYDLEARYQKFVSLTGIDDADVNGQGDVTIRVIADGKEVFNKAGVTKKGGPVKIDVPVTGVKQLELVVEFGGNMHLGDITSWADAHLIKK